MGLRSAGLGRHRRLVDAHLAGSSGWRPGGPRVAGSYGFLTQHLNSHEGRSVRRAHATIAQLSDL